MADGMEEYNLDTTTHPPDDVLVSVITVVFNGEKFLETAIRSVISQADRNLEYLIIDGGSNDRTVEIIKDYSTYVDYWVSEPDAGIYHAMNKGILRSKGKIIGILNSDDWYEDGVVSGVRAVFERHPEIELIYGAMNIVRPDGTLEKRVRSKEFRTDTYSAPFNHPTCFLRRSAYERIGIFDQTFATAADYDLMLRFKNAGMRYLYIDTPITNFRLGGATSQSIEFPLRQINGVLKKNGYSVFARFKAIGFRIVRYLLLRLLIVLRLREPR